MNRTGSLVTTLALITTGCQEYGFNKEYPDFGDSMVPPLEQVSQRDEIMQVTTPTVDILWTIDNSCSMADEQSALTENFPYFMDYFLGSGLDYHVGVTSTDIDRAYNGSQGSLVEAMGIKYIDLDTPSPIEVFSAMATLGVSGSGNEKGLGGTYMCLEEKIDTVNAGFWRDEAAIHTIIISDEPDMTPSSVITQSEFIAWYDGLKDETDMRTFSSIASPQFGGDYINATNEIGGIYWDIGQGDWPQLLERLGVQAAGLRREYFLSHLPVPGTIQVSVEDVSGAELQFFEAEIDPYTGEPVDADGDGVPEGDWYYLPERNSITFIEYIPNSLSTVVLEYVLLAAQQGDVIVEEAD